MIRTCSLPVAQARHARVLGALDAAEDGAVLLDAVADDAAAAMSALRRQRVNGALERIEGVLVVAHRDRERLVVIVAADFAFHVCDLRDWWRDTSGTSMPRAVAS